MKSEIYKVCSCCGLVLPIENFWRNNNPKKSPDGRQSYCKSCNYKAHSKWVAEHPECMRNLLKNWFKSHWEQVLDYRFIYKKAYRKGIKRKGNGNGSIINPLFCPISRKRQRHYERKPG